MNRRAPVVPVLAALVEAVHSSPEPIPATAVRARARHLLSGVPVTEVTDADLTDAMSTLAAMGLVRSWCDRWSPGPTPRDLLTIDQALERDWWRQRRRRRLLDREPG